MGRELDGRKIGQDDPLLALLKRGDEIKQGVRAKFPHGRANVRTDMEAIDNESTHLRVAAREVSLKLLGTSPKKRWYANATARAELLGTGNCGEHMTVTVANAGPGLADGESLDMRSHRRQDHSWPELDSQGLRVNLDAWSDGPTIDVADGRYSRRRKDSKVVFDFDRKAAQTFVESVNEQLETIAAGWLPRFRARYEERASNPAPCGSIWEPEPVIDSRFAQRVRDRIKSETPPVQHESIGQRFKRFKHRAIAAIGVGTDVRARAQEKIRLDERGRARPVHSPEQWNRQLRKMAYDSALLAGATKEEAQGAIDEILQEAARLDQPIPREVRKPDIDALLGPSAVSSCEAAQSAAAGSSNPASGSAP
jgi:hypothetical protein